MTVRIDRDKKCLVVEKVESDVAIQTLSTTIETLKRENEELQDKLKDFEKQGSRNRDEREERPR